MTLDVMASPVGFLHLTSSNVGLTSLCIAGTKTQTAVIAKMKHDMKNPLEEPMLIEKDKFSATSSNKAIQILYNAEQELNEYFNGDRKVFTIPLDESIGTTFQKLVWQELRNIPYGVTCSYSDIAARIDNPKAVRAVGTANGKNPWCIITPCHRYVCVS